MYRVREFAALAGVTVRALHHYDQLGLLKPLRHTRTSYRLYRDSDLARLEQIVVLKFLGIPLREIGALLKSAKPAKLRDVLQQQQRVLRQKRHRLEAAIGAIERAERSLGCSGEPDWNLFTLVVREIEMENNTDWAKKYYSENAKAKVDARRALWTPELQERATRDWTQLVNDVAAAAARGDDPQSDAGQQLASRWRELLAGFTGGDPEIQQGLNHMWADREHWPEGEAKSFSMPTKVVDFIRRAQSRM
jgi:DNA-binding transcriptional MerR regulator